MPATPPSAASPSRPHRRDPHRRRHVLSEPAAARTWRRRGCRRSQPRTLYATTSSRRVAPRARHPGATDTAAARRRRPRTRPVEEAIERIVRASSRSATATPSSSTSRSSSTRRGRAPPRRAHARGLQRGIESGSSAKTSRRVLSSSSARSDVRGQAHQRGMLGLEEATPPPRTVPRRRRTR